MSFVLHVCFYVLLEHDGTWDTSDPCQNVSAFKLCEASRFPDCMLDTWVVSSNSQHIQAGRWPQKNHGKAWLRNRDCNGLQGTASLQDIFFCQDLVLTCVCDFLASQVSRWKKLRFK